MLQALAFAAAGSFYPVGLLLVLRYLSASRGMVLAKMFLLGGASGCLLVSVAELALLHALPLTRSEHPTPNGAVYIAFGAVLIAFCIVLATRRRRPPETVSALATPTPAGADPTPRRALAMGLVVYAPGIGLLAAVKALFDAGLSLAKTIVGLILCIVIVLWMAEVPILATTISPQRSAPMLRRAGRLVTSKGRSIAIVIGLLLGAYLVLEGIHIIRVG